MPRLEFTPLLARLLSDRRLRERFAADRAAVAAELSADTAMREALLALDAAALELQAQGLVDKRRGEVANFLPLTLENLAGEASALFDAHAQQFWPQGHRRHLNDAVAFAAFLQQRGKPVDSGELNRLHFIERKRFLRLALIRRATTGGKRRRAVQVLYRGDRGDPQELLIRFGS